MRRATAAMTTKTEMWLTFNAEKEKIHIPVLPEEFVVSVGTKDKSVDIVGLGEILVAQSKAAREFSFSSFFPATKFPGLQAGKIEQKPTTLRDTILKWKNSKKPVHLIVTGHGIDCYCRISKFRPTEKGGDVGTIYYDITLKEYTEVKVRQITIKKNTATTPKKTTTRTDNRNTNIKVGDIVNFAGGYHYYTSMSTSHSGKTTAGKAYVEAINKSGKHKYALIGGMWRNDVPGNSSVYGWVDESTVS